MIFHRTICGLHGVCLTDAKLDLLYNFDKWIALIVFLSSKSFFTLGISFAFLIDSHVIYNLTSLEEYVRLNILINLILDYFVIISIYLIDVCKKINISHN